MLPLTPQAYFFIWNGFFFTLLIYCAFIAFGQWRLSKDRAILWYLGYLASNLGHYLWQFGKDLTLSGSRSGMLIEMDFPLSYLSSACYLMFIWVVFDVKNTVPRFAWFFIGVSWFYSVMFGINILLQIFTSYDVMVVVHRTVRTLVFPLMLWVLIYLWFRRARLFYEKLIMIGTLAVLLGVVSAVVARDAHPPGIPQVSDFMHCFSTSFGKICLYDVKVGVAIDVICFSWALTLRQKLTLQKLVPPTLPIYIVPFAAPANDAFIAIVDAFLNQKYNDENLTIKDIAKGLNLSDSQVNRKLKVKVGMTTEQYLLRFRLDKALGMLLESDEKTINQIGSEVGLKEVSLFSRAFKKQFGQTPSEVRKKAREIVHNNQQHAG